MMVHHLIFMFPDTLLGLDLDPTWNRPYDLLYTINLGLWKTSVRCFLDE